MKIISFYNHKGGVGKTTNTILSATNLNYYFKKKVCIIDCDDDQWSTSEEYEDEYKSLQNDYKGEEIKHLIESKRIVQYDIFEEYVKNVPSLIESFKEDYDYVFLDLGNRYLDQSKELFNKIDHFIIPFSRDRKEFKKAIQFYSFLNDNFPKSLKTLLLIKLELRDNHLESFKGILDYFEKKSWDYFSQPILSRERYTNKYCSFFFPLSKKIEEKETHFNYINFLKEFIKKT